jgi:ABC-2 type transport system permease protein
MKAFRHLFLAHLREFLRDRMALFWTFAFVLFFALIFGLVVGQTWTPAARVVVVTDAGGDVTRRLIAELRRLDSFDVVEASRPDGDRLWRAGQVHAVVSVQDQADVTLANGHAASVQVVYDAEDRPSKGVLAVVGAALARVEGGALSQPGRLRLTATNQARTSLRAVDLFIPGVLTMLLMQLGLFGASMPMISLRVQGVLRRLQATPLPRLVMIAAPIAVRLVIVALQLLVIAGVAVFVFGVTLGGGSRVSAVAIAALGAAAFIGIGLLIATTARTVEGGNVLASALQVPMVFLSGILFPIESAPAFLRPVMSIWPSTHLGDALRQTMIGAPPVYGLLVNTLVLTAWLLVAGGLAIRGLSLEWGK